MSAPTAEGGRSHALAEGNRDAEASVGALLEPILVCGKGRSGSTVLMALLGTSPAVAVDHVYPYENRVLVYLMSLVSGLAQVDGGSGSKAESGGFPADWSPFARWGAAVPAPPAFSVSPLLEGTPGSEPFGDEAFRALWSAFSERARRSVPDARFYPEKFPWELLEAFPRLLPARVVFHVRDPRDVWVSTRSFDRRRGYRGFNDAAPDEGGGTYLESFLAMMRQLFRAMDEVRASGMDSHLFRYERLIEEPESEVAALANWLGSELSGETAQRRTRKFVEHRTSASSMASIGRWRTELAPEQRAIIEGELGEDMRRLGYL